ncbi:protein of unknown function (plasmid) [Pararobbsia alpina]
MRKLITLCQRAKHSIDTDPDMDAFWLAALIIVIVVRVFA